MNTDSQRLSFSDVPNKKINKQKKLAKMRIIVTAGAVLFVSRDGSTQNLLHSVTRQLERDFSGNQGFHRPNELFSQICFKKIINFNRAKIFCVLSELLALAD